METNLLKRKLTDEERKELLYELFGFELIDCGDKDKPHFVIYDSEGDEFYGSDENCKFNFDTLYDFFDYTSHLSEEKGVRKAQWNIQKALGLV